MAMLGTICGGFLSDHLLNKRKSRTVARKVPIMTGLAATCLIFTVNFFENQLLIAVAILSICFFANAFSNFGWVVLTDIVPKNILGTVGGVLNICGNLSGIVSPIIIGALLDMSGNFHLAMYYVAGVALVGLLAYIFLVDKIEQIKFPTEIEKI